MGCQLAYHPTSAQKLTFARDQGILLRSGRESGTHRPRPGEESLPRGQCWHHGTVIPALLILINTQYSKSGDQPARDGNASFFTSRVRFPPLLSPPQAPVHLGVLGEK